jgi:phage gpG-like protein
MTAFTVEVLDQQARAALKTLAARIHNPAAVMHTIAEGITERTKHRFDTGKGPDGQAWKPNSAATLGMLSAKLAGSKSNRKKDGSLNAKGSRALANKKPLIESGFLRQQIVPSSTATSLSVTATALYAAIHQFGGKAGRGLSVTIPARPFLPIHQDGSLYPQESELILGEINAFLMEGLS